MLVTEDNDYNFYFQKLPKKKKKNRNELTKWKGRQNQE